MALSSATGNGTGGVDDISKRWRELQGENSWKGLLDPLDLDLRKSIISYGELAAATYDGFNTERRSPHYGQCMYGPDDLLAKSGVANASHYMVTKLVYAPESSEENTKPPTWIGYVAVATDVEGVAALGRRDVVVAWRGSVTGAEWFKDIQLLLTLAWPVLGTAESFAHPTAMVHSGFLSLYTTGGGGGGGSASAREQVLEEVKRLMELYKHEETSITVVGHSLGAALAVLNAVDLVGNNVNSRSSWLSPSSSCPVTAIVFASPQVGNVDFKDAMESFADLRVLHVRNDRDIVPKFMKCWLLDLGVTLPIDTTRSPYLKDLGAMLPIDTARLHNLQCYLHGVAGEAGGDGGEFKLVVDRDVALVNKNVDALKDEYQVPDSWWVPQYKNMAKNDRGKWELKDFVQ